MPLPKVRIAFLESGGGWIAGWLDRMDRHFQDGGVFDDSSLRMRPSEYFWRQCWISFEPVEGSPTMIAEKLSEKNRRQVLAESAIQFYKLT